MRYRKNERHQTQEELVENSLLRGESITPLEALHRFGAFRLSAIIFNLRKKGYNISTKMVGNNTKFALYKLESSDQKEIDSQK